MFVEEMMNLSIKIDGGVVEVMFMVESEEGGGGRERIK